MRVLVYLGRSPTLGIAYSAHSPNASTLYGHCDANWSETRSYTGFCFMLAGGTIANCCQRQHCISMSSCEAELIALAAAAIELIFLMSLLKDIGYEFDGPVDVSTDNKGAYDLCHRFSSAQHSRHVDRKMFKMRELRGAGIVNVRWVPTDDNFADLFTKILGRQPFEKHRRTVLNLDANEAVEKARAARSKG